jgi:hypothetical protein
LTIATPKDDGSERQPSGNVDRIEDSGRKGGARPSVLRSRISRKVALHQDSRVLWFREVPGPKPQLLNPVEIRVEGAGFRVQGAGCRV